MNDRPLVTFALLAYNQECFIREAVEGAFSQTYSPLEIILSDDHSSDLTFDIMREMTSQYTGPHEVVVNRNDANLGIGGHVNRVMEIARGELIVGAAGDDVSLPDRCEQLIEYWQETGSKLKSIYSDAILVDKIGQSIGFATGPPFISSLNEMLRHLMPGVKGCTHAWTRDVFTRFGPILPDTVYEDRVIPLRSYLSGGIGYCPKQLVRYRIHDSNISRYHLTSKDTILRKSIELQRRHLNVYHNYIHDLTCAYRLGLIDKTNLHRTLTTLERYIDLFDDMIRFLEGGYIAKLDLMLKHSTRNPVQVAKWAFYLLCPLIYRWMLSKKIVGWRRA